MANGNVHNGENRSSRRTFLTAGIGTATGIFALPELVRGGISTVEIPIHIKNEDIIRYKEVSEAWWEYTKTVKNIQKTLARNASATSVKEVERLPGSEFFTPSMHEKRRSWKIRIHGRSRDAAQKVRDSTPQSINGINIEVVEGSDNVNISSTYDFEYIPGGTPGGARSNYGTLTCRVDYGGDQHMMAARHLFADSDEYAGRCETTSQTNKAGYCDGDTFGYISDGWQEHDIVVIGFRSNSPFEGFSRKIANESDARVRGHMSEARIDDYISRYDQIKKRGYKTGTKSGRIISQTNVVTCSNEGENLTDMVRADIYQEHGDSGGPMYEVYSEPYREHDGIYIAAPATQKNNVSDALGSAAWKIVEDTDISFHS